ncbi:MAG: hypothetical protein ACXQTY_06865 [Candidatus Methanogasteraceae archaeon]
MKNEKSSTGRTIHDTDSYLQSLIVTNPLQEPVMRCMVRALNLPPGSGGLDVGCGIGLQANACRGSGGGGVCHRR